MAWIIAYVLAKKVQRIAITSPLTFDLDFGTYRGINVGTPVDPNDISRKTDLDSHNVAEAQHGLTTGEYIAKTDRVDQIVSRDYMEYPVVDVSLGYLLGILKANYYPRGPTYSCLITTNSFADKRLEGLVQPGPGYQDGNYICRYVDADNMYLAYLWTGAATADHEIGKYVAGVYTALATEAVDLTDKENFAYAFEVLGTSLATYRAREAVPTTATLSATDTDIVSGKFGVNLYSSWAATMLKAPSSSMPRVLAYFEVPIVGTGTPEDPYRPQMPYEEYTDPKLGKRNLLALSHASLIPVDRTTGKPIHGVALVRIFEQPDRDPALRDIPTCLDTLRGMAGVTELTREGAISRAKTLDPKLTDFDLRRFSKTAAERMAKEYVRWRKDTFKVEITEEEAIRYLMADKAW